jgi:hypothetical protein
LTPINIGGALQELEEVLEEVHDVDEWPEDVDEQEVVGRIRAFTAYLEEHLLMDDES